MAGSVDAPLRTRFRAVGRLRDSAPDARRRARSRKNGRRPAPSSKRHSTSHKLRRGGCPRARTRDRDRRPVGQLESSNSAVREPGAERRVSQKASRAKACTSNNCATTHATSSTAPGHAALFTGLPPRESGVFANERLDETSSKPTSIFSDPTTHEILDDAALDTVSSSAKQLRSDTLADALRAQRPDARIISLSLKDRAAIPGGGKNPDAVVWFDNHRGVFVTSSAFHAALPTWVRTENRALEAAASEPWKPLDEAWLREHAPTPDRPIRAKAISVPASRFRTNYRRTNSVSPPSAASQPPIGPCSR